MSETPRPLWELVEQWEKSWCGPTIGGALQVCARELAAALRAWDEELSKQGWSPRTVEAFERILGVPPKEPASKP